MLYQSVQSLNPGECDIHTTPSPAPGDVLIDYIDERGRFRRLSCCLDCLVLLLPFIADIDAADVVVWFARPGAPGVLPEPHPEPPTAPVLALVGASA